MGDREVVTAVERLTDVAYQLVDQQKETNTLLFHIGKLLKEK